MSKYIRVCCVLQKIKSERVSTATGKQQFLFFLFLVSMNSGVSRTKKHAWAPSRGRLKGFPAGNLCFFKVRSSVLTAALFPSPSCQNCKVGKNPSDLRTPPRGPRAAGFAYARSHGDAGGAAWTRALEGHFAESDFLWFVYEVVFMYRFIFFNVYTAEKRFSL